VAKEDFEQLSVEQLRDTGAFIPELNGFALWSKTLECEYCATTLVGKVIVLQSVKSQSIHFMCPACFRRLLARV